MEFPYNLIQGQRAQEDTVRVYVYVQSEYVQIDETSLAHAIQQWMTSNVPDIQSTTAERHEQLFPVTPIPPAGS